MEGKICLKNLGVTNRILLGLLMFIPGLSKLGVLSFLGSAFTMSPSGITSMLSAITIFSWAPVFWTWILILSEVIFGLAILVNWKMKYSVYPPAIIMVLAGLTMYLVNPSLLLMHFAVAVNYIMIGCKK